MNSSELTSLFDTMNAANAARSAVVKVIHRIQSVAGAVKGSRRADVDYTQKWLTKQVIYGNSAYGSSPFNTGMDVHELDIPSVDTVSVGLREWGVDEVDEPLIHWYIPFNWFTLTNAELSEAINAWLDTLMVAAKETERAAAARTEAANQTKAENKLAKDRTEYERLKAQFETASHTAS